MANKRYVCVQACQLGGKRYEVGECLADGVEPNSHFKDNQTGEMVKAKKPDPIPANIESMELDTVKKELAAADKKLEDFKNLVGEHLAKFDKRLEILEKGYAAKKSNAEAKAKGESKDKEAETKQEQPAGNEGTLPEGNEQPDNPAKK